MQGHGGGIVDEPGEPIRRVKVGCKVETIIYFASYYKLLSYLCCFMLFKLLSVRSVCSASL